MTGLLTAFGEKRQFTLGRQGWNVNAGYFFTPAEQVTSPTLSPPPPSKEAKVKPTTVKWPHVRTDEFHSPHAIFSSSFARQVCSFSWNKNFTPSPSKFFLFLLPKTPKELFNKKPLQAPSCNHRDVCLVTTFLWCHWVFS